MLLRLPLAAPIGLSQLPIPTHCGSERVLVVSTEPLGDLSCLTTLGWVVGWDPWTPHPFKGMGQITFRTFGQSKIFSGAFGAN